MTLLLAIALSTASYGGGDTTQNTIDSSGPVDSAAIQVARILAVQKGNPLDKKDLELYSPSPYSNPLEIQEFRPHGYDGYTLSIVCYPYNTGGYYVLVIWDWVFDRPDDEDYISYKFKDGILTRTKSLLPTPGIDDFFANAEAYLNDHLAFRETVISAVLRANLSLGESPSAQVP